MKRIVIAVLLAFALAGCAQPVPPAPYTPEEESAPAFVAGREVEVPPVRRPTLSWRGAWVGAGGKVLPLCEWGAEQALRAIWRVRSADSWGTAFHVGNGYWRTAAHVADGGRLWLVDHDGRWHRARVVSSLDAFSELEGWERTAEDEALLHAPSTSGAHAIKRASATPRAWAEARIVGHPRGRFRELVVVVERSPRGCPMAWWRTAAVWGRGAAVRRSWTSAGGPSRRMSPSAMTGRASASRGCRGRAYRGGPRGNPFRRGPQSPGDSRRAGA